jgi:hypothetical protein
VQVTGEVRSNGSNSGLDAVRPCVKVTLVTVKVESGSPSSSNACRFPRTSRIDGPEKGSPERSQKTAPSAESVGDGERQ